MGRAARRDRPRPDLVGLPRRLELARQDVRRPAGDVDPRGRPRRPRRDARSPSSPGSRPAGHRSRRRAGRSPLVSGIVSAAYFVPLSAAYRRGALSSVYPVARGSGALLGVVIGVDVLGERLAPAGLRRRRPAARRDARRRPARPRRGRRSRRRCWQGAPSPTTRRSTGSASGPGRRGCTPGSCGRSAPSGSSPGACASRWVRAPAGAVRDADPTAIARARPRRPGARVLRGDAPRPTAPRRPLARGRALDDRHVHADPARLRRSRRSPAWRRCARRPRSSPRPGASSSSASATARACGSRRPAPWPSGRSSSPRAAAAGPSGVGRPGGQQSRPAGRRCARDSRCRAEGLDDAAFVEAMPADARAPPRRAGGEHSVRMSPAPSVSTTSTASTRTAPESPLALHRSRRPAVTAAAGARATRPSGPASRRRRRARAGGRKAADAAAHVRERDQRLERRAPRSGVEECRDPGRPRRQEHRLGERRKWPSASTMPAPASRRAGSAEGGATGGPVGARDDRPRAGPRRHEDRRHGGGVSGSAPRRQEHATVLEIGRREPGERMCAENRQQAGRRAGPGAGDRRVRGRAARRDQLRGGDDLLVRPRDALDAEDEIERDEADEEGTGAVVAGVAPVVRRDAVRRFRRRRVPPAAASGGTMP